MSFFDAFILGLVQGITEFLPISSSGHLLVFSQILGVDDLPLSFTLATHLSTLIAIIIVLRSQIFNCIKQPFSPLNRYIFMATLTTGIVFIAFKGFIGTLADYSFVPYYFIITAIVLMASTLVRQKPQMLSVNFTKSIAVGLAQGIAILPGISRSGMTISMCKFLGIEQKKAAEFSFLISIPIIIISCGFDFLYGGSFDGISIAALAVACVTSFVSGLFALKFMLKILSSSSFDIFAIYLVFLSIFLLLNNNFLFIF